MEIKGRVRQILHGSQNEMKGRGAGVLWNSFTDEVSEFASAIELIISWLSLRRRNFWRFGAPSKLYGGPSKLIFNEFHP